MWTEKEILDYAGKLAKEVAAFAETKVKPALGFLLENKTTLGIEKELPGGTKLVSALKLIDVELTAGLKLVPKISQLFAVYELYKRLGGQPMGQAEFDRLEESRGRQE